MSSALVRLFPSLDLPYIRNSIAAGYACGVSSLCNSGTHFTPVVQLENTITPITTLRNLTLAPSSSAMLTPMTDEPMPENETPPTPDAAPTQRPLSHNEIADIMGVSNDDVTPTPTKPSYEAIAAEQLAEQRRLDTLRKDLEAVRSELTGTNGDGDPSNDPTLSELNRQRKKVTDLFPDAVATLKHLLIYADSEAVRATIAKYITESTLKDYKPGNNDEELAAFLKSLSTKKAKPRSTS